MIPTQEIKCSNASDRSFIAFLESTQGGSQAFVTVTDQGIHYADFNSAEGIEALYKKLLEKWDERVDELEDSIVWIDNPCNAELIDVKAQQAILDELGFDYVELRLNGIPVNC